MIIKLKILKEQLPSIIVLSIASLFTLAVFMQGITYYESGIDRIFTPVLAQQENTNGTIASTDMKSVVDAAIKEATYYTIENATTPAVTIDPNVYAVYFRNDNNDSEQWIPPTTQYLAMDAYNNSWIAFVNSEGLEKSLTYEEDFNYVGNGTVQLSVVDNHGNIVRNGPFAMGEITKHYPYTSEVNGKIAFSWIDGDDVKLAFVNTNPREDMV